MPENQFGIENLKGPTKFVCDMAKQVAEVTADGKVKPIELVQFFDELIRLPEIIKKFPETLKEGGDVNDEEFQELKNFLVVNFDLPNDATEEFVEQAVINVVSFVRMIKLLKKPKV